MYTNWSSFALVLFTDQRGEATVLSIRSFSRTCGNQLKLPGGPKGAADADSVTTLLRHLKSQVGIEAKPHQVTRVNPYDKSQKKLKTSSPLRFYRVTITMDSFLTRHATPEDLAIEFVPVRAISREEEYDPVHAGFLRAYYAKKLEVVPSISP